MVEEIRDRNFLSVSYVCLCPCFPEGRIVKLLEVGEEKEGETAIQLARVGTVVSQLKEGIGLGQKVKGRR